MEQCLSHTATLRCTFDGNRVERGAVLFIENKSNLTFDKCRFLNPSGTVVDANGNSCITDTRSIYENNTANLGAVVYVFNSNMSFFGSRFSKNKADKKDGVIFLYKSNVSFNKCEAIGNFAENGGVLYQLFRSLIITASNITINICGIRNRHTELGGGLGIHP